VQGHIALEPVQQDYLYALLGVRPRGGAAGARGNDRAAAAAAAADAHAQRQAAGIAKARSRAEELFAVAGSQTTIASATTCLRMRQHAALAGSSGGAGLVYGWGWECRFAGVLDGAANLHCGECCPPSCA